MTNCKDVDSLVQYLEQNKFSYDEESGIMSCDICLSGGGIIGKSVDEKKTGYFKVDKDKDNLQKLGNRDQQPKVTFWSTCFGLREGKRMHTIRNSWKGLKQSSWQSLKDNPGLTRLE